MVTSAHGQSTSQYHQLDSGIHVLTLLKPSRQGVDELLETLGQIFETVDGKETTVKLLIDIRVGMPPMSYARQEIGKLFRSLEKPIPLRSAYVYRSGVLVSIAKTFLETLRINSTKRRFFNNLDEAIAWLEKT